MTNVNTSVTELNPLGGATLAGKKFGLVTSITKAVTADTITVTNAQEIYFSNLNFDTTGVHEPFTFTTATTGKLTGTTGSTGKVSGIIIYR